MSQPVEQIPLDDNIGYVLKVAATALHTAMDAALRPEGLTVSQYSCLELLGRVPGQTNAKLARGAFVTPQSMNDLLRGLQRRGLVERPDEVDVGRARPSHLTARGRQALDAARTALDGVSNTTAVVAAEHPHLLADLKAIVRALEG